LLGCSVVIAGISIVVIVAHCRRGRDRGIAQRAELGELSIVNELLLERHAAARVRQAGLPPAHFLPTARFSTF
jgi:hypothetical protein